jgi:hypothetical protein
VISRVQRGSAEQRFQGVSGEQRGSGSFRWPTEFRKFKMIIRVQGVSGEQRGSGSFR